MGIIVAFLLITPIAYSSYIIPLTDEEPTVRVLIRQPVPSPEVDLPDVLGASVDWTENANGLYEDVFGLLNPAPVGELINLEPSHLRFPATHLSQVYDWTLGVGNRNDRGENPVHGGATAPTRFGTDEFFKLVDHTGAEAVMVVNANTGTANKSANWVSYCNDDQFTRQGRTRAANGYYTPYGIKDWEIGYEPYIPRYWSGVSTSETPAGTQYGLRVRDFAERMKAIDPTIKVGAWMVLDPELELHSADPSWNMNFLNAAEGMFEVGERDYFYFDYVVVSVHLPGIDTLLDFPDLFRYSYATTMRNLMDDLDQLQRLLATTSRGGGPIPLGIASFQPEFGDSGWNTQAPGYAASAVITADMAIQLLDATLENGKQRIRYACYGELNTPTYEALMINPDFEASHLDTWGRSPNYLAFQLATKLQGGEPLLVSQLEPVTFDVETGRDLSGVKNVPLVSAFATGDPDKGIVHILLLNRDLERTVDCRLDVEMTGLSSLASLSVRPIDHESLLGTNLARETVRSPPPDDDRDVNPSGFKVRLGPASVVLLTLETGGS